MIERDENGVEIRNIWDDSYIGKTFWFRVRGSLSKDIVYRFKYIFDSDKSTLPYPLPVCLWYNGARWVAWIPNLFVCEPTDYTDPRKPPFEWAESMHTLVNN